MLWLVAMKERSNGPSCKRDLSLTSFSSTLLSRPCSSSLDLMRASVKRLP